MDERLRKAPCAFLSMDHNCNITEVNETFLQWMDYKKDDVMGKHIESFLRPGNKMIFHSIFYPSISLSGRVEELFIKLKNRSGEEVPYLLNAKLVDGDNTNTIDCILVQMKNRIEYELELRGMKKQLEEAYFEKKQAFERLEQIYRDIEKKQTELMEMNSDLFKMSMTDKLTGIANRRYLQEALESQIDLYWKEGIGFSLLAIDIDYFKQVNDTYGHQVGDAVLIQLASLLKELLNEQGTVTRFGGEEFIVILPGKNTDEALQISRLINQEVNRASWEETGSLTVSVGAATFTETDTGETIINKADQALYFSKENGRNCATHHNQLEEE